MKTIPVTGSTELMLVDDEDFPLMSRHVWDTRKEYAPRTSINSRLFSAAQLVRPCPGRLANFVNGNRLDLRKENLRCADHPCVKANNNMSSRNTSGFRGVMYIKKTGSWKGQVGFENKYFPKTGFATASQAAEWRDNKVRQLGIACARFNFPLPGERGLDGEIAPHTGQALT